MPQQAVQEKPQEAPVFFVRDKHASKRRLHDVRNMDTGETARYEFPPNPEGIYLPPEFAMSLVENPGFEVKDSHGNVIRPRKTTDKGGQQIVLAANEAIIPYEHVNHGYLIQLAADAGKAFTKAARKEEIIAWLIENNAAQAALEARTQEIRKASSEEDEVDDGFDDTDLSMDFED